MKRPPSDPLRYEPPCAGCGGPHGVAACSTEAAARLLEVDGKVMTAHEVRRRIAAKGGAA